MKKPDPGALFRKADPLFDDSLFADMYPTLWEHLTAVKWEDGTNRTTTTLMIFVDTGVLKCCINDRDANRSAFVTGSTYTEMMERIECGLRDNSLDWRGKKPYGNAGNNVPY